MQCKNCGSQNVVGGKFCSACGAKSVTHPNLSMFNDGERRHMTVLFSDLVGSTEVAAGMDPETWHNIISRYQQSAADAVTNLGGYVAKFLGDGVVAYFGYPRAMEDAPERAVRAGLAIIRAINALNETRDHDARLDVRVGLHAGSVVVAPIGGLEADVFGDVPNIAARVQSAAQANTVAMTEIVRKAIAGRILVQEIGSFQLKGIPQKMPLYQAAQDLPEVSIFSPQKADELTVFVGRENELHRVVDRRDRARRGELQVVLITGEPGIGKSRLLEEVRKTNEGQPHLWIECAGQPLFKNSPFYVVGQMLFHGLRLPDADKSVQSKMLEKQLLAGGNSEVEVLSLIAELLELPLPEGILPLAMSPEEKRERIFSVLKTWLLDLAGDKLVILALQDLHWVDPSSLEFVSRLIRGESLAQLLIVCTARPEFRPAWPVDHRHMHVVLDRMDKAQTRELVLSTLKMPNAPSDLIHDIVERADGIPLFAEELSKFFVETHQDTGSTEIPTTLKDLLSARVDSSGPARVTAQLAAAIGRDFTFELLLAVSSMTEIELDETLSLLIQANLVQSDDDEPRGKYRFRHALICDAAYEGLLRTQRRRLHRRIAKTITEDFKVLAELHPELVAKHWSESGEHDNARLTWQKTAKAAASRHAHSEAVVAFKNALLANAARTESPASKADELQLWQGLVGVLQIAHGYSAHETQSAMEKTRRLIGESGDMRKRFNHLAGEWMAASNAGDYPAAKLIADQLPSLAIQTQAVDSVATAQMILMTSRYRTGDLVGADDAFAKGKKYFYAPEFRRLPGALAQVLGNAAINAWILGDPKEAELRIQPVLNVARTSEHLYERAFSGYMAGMLLLLLGNVEISETLAKDSIRCSKEGGFPQFVWNSTIVLGRARAERGDVENGLAIISDGLRGFEATRSRAGITMYLTWLAATQYSCGAISEAISTLDRALSINPAEQYFRPESYRLRGEIHMKANDRTRAAHDLYLANTLAISMKAVLFEKRINETILDLFDSDG